MKNKHQTLLEKAKSIVIKTHVGRKVSEEELDLILAWIKGDVQLQQVAGALGKSKKTGNTLYYLATYLKNAYRQGMIRVVKVKKK